MQKLISLAASLLLVACATGGTNGPTLSVTASPTDYQPFFAAGTGVIEGQALTQRSGAPATITGSGQTASGEEVSTAGKQLVTLDPATPYALEWYRMYGNTPIRFDAMPTDSLFRRARRTTTADDEGRFRFEGLPPGEYIVRTRINWTVPRDQFRSERRGGVAGSVVTVGAGERQQVQLNGLLTPVMVF